MTGKRGGELLFGMKFKIKKTPIALDLDQGEVD